MRRAILVLGVLALVAGAFAAGLLVAYMPTWTASAQPIEYTVVRGDTLFLIGKAHGVTAEQLREWNGIEGDRIEVGQVLQIWPADGAPVAELAPKQRKRRKSSGATISGTSEPAGSALVLPAEQPCVQAPTEVDGDHGFATAAGLDAADVRSAMSDFVHHTLRCFPPGTPSGTIHTEIVVACSGRVAKVGVLDAGGLPDEAAACVRDTLAYAPFPAHDMPDGYAFEYPLRFEAP